MLSNRNLIDNTFSSTDNDHPENQVFLNILPIHHVFCINCDVLVSLRYGNILCLNRDMSRLADHLLLFEPTAFRAVPMVAKALYNRFCLLRKQNPDRERGGVKGRGISENDCAEYPAAEDISLRSLRRTILGSGDFHRTGIRNV